MKQFLIPQLANNSLSKLIRDFLNATDRLEKYYNNLPLAKTIEQREKHFAVDRKLLATVLSSDYKKVTKLTDLVASNIALLEKNNTYTVTTGHQPCLFLGPAYFIYKISTTIRICEELKAQYPDKNFVPVFWLASEDHDLEELNQFYSFNDKLTLPIKQTGGAVGRMKLDGVEEVFNYFNEKNIAKTALEEAVLNKFKSYYKTENTFSQAAFGIINELFGDYGLIILDGDNKALKTSLIPKIIADITTAENYNRITQTSEEFKNRGYKAQLTPREINFFYLERNQRNRIVKESDKYKVLNTTIEFTEEEIRQHIFDYPERFSPNAALRTIYQESILPNIAYVGGAGELSYWLQLKAMFNDNKVFYPKLILRDSYFYINKSMEKKINQLNLTPLDFFQPPHLLVKDFLSKTQDFDFSSQQYLEMINQLFSKLAQEVSVIENQISRRLETTKVLFNKEIKQLEKTINKTFKQSHSESVNKIEKVRGYFFPEGILQERRLSSFSLLLQNNSDLIKTLVTPRKP